MQVLPLETIELNVQECVHHKIWFMCKLCVTFILSTLSFGEKTEGKAFECPI